jgi:hypothetical protein
MAGISMKHETMDVDSDDDFQQIVDAAAATTTEQFDAKKFELAFVSDPANLYIPEAKSKLKSKPKRIAVTKSKTKTKAKSAAALEREAKMARLNAITYNPPPQQIGQRPEVNVSDVMSITKSFGSAAAHVMIEAVCDQEISVAQKQTVRRAWSRRSNKYPIVDSTPGVMNITVLENLNRDRIVVQCSGMRDVSDTRDEKKKTEDAERPSFSNAKAQAAYEAMEAKRAETAEKDRAASYSGMKARRCLIEGVLKPFDLAKRGMAPTPAIPGGDIAVQWCQWCCQVAYCCEECFKSDVEHQWICSAATTSLVDPIHGAILRRQAVRVGFSDRSFTPRGPLGNAVLGQKQKVSTMRMSADSCGVVNVSRMKE